MSEHSPAAGGSAFSNIDRQVLESISPYQRAAYPCHLLGDLAEAGVLDESDREALKNTQNRSLLVTNQFAAFVENSFKSG